MATRSLRSSHSMAACSSAVSSFSCGVGGSGSAGTPYAVQYVFQKLTDEQKEQARENIGAGNAGQINVKKYGISTDGSDTARGMWLRLGGVTLLLGAFVAVVWWILSKSHKAKQGR